MIQGGLCRKWVRGKTLFLGLAFFFLIPGGSQAAEQDAAAISDTIFGRHLPHGTVLDPIFSSPTSTEIVGYTRCGDSATWTGHLLAAEALHYRVTGSPAALDRVKRVLEGIRSLVDITGTNLLSRCYIPVNWQFAPSILGEENHNGVYRNTLAGQEYYWFGNTSRDQYAGIFFGLGVAYEFVLDGQVRGAISQLVTRLLDYLIGNGWSVVMPNGSISTTFVGRPDQRLSFLAVGRMVNNDRFASIYSSDRFVYWPTVSAPIGYDVLDAHSSYFKFNLDSITLYNLVRLEGSSFYHDRFLEAYQILRRTTDDHGNAHFDVIDRGLRGPEAVRDQRIRDELSQWLLRSRRNEQLDWRGNPQYPACGDDRACNPIPIVNQIRTDFLWQRSPFLLYGGGDGRVETAGIDYILPYWMARFYGVVGD